VPFGWVLLPPAGSGSAQDAKGRAALPQRRLPAAHQHPAPPAAPISFVVCQQSINEKGRQMKIIPPLEQRPSASERRNQPSRRPGRFGGMQLLTAMELLLCAPLMRAQNYAPAKCAPPPDGKYSQTQLMNYHSSYPDLSISEGWGVSHGGFTACIDPPASGGTQDHHFDSSVDLHLVSGGCLRAPAAVRVRLRRCEKIGLAHN
jgi:hypothetical protein